jgi:hypothetical protein
MICSYYFDHIISSDEPSYHIVDELMGELYKGKNSLLIGVGGKLNLQWYFGSHGKIIGTPATK